MRELNLGNNALTDRSLRRLIASPLFHSLKTLELERNAFSREGLTALVAAAIEHPMLKRLAVKGDFVEDSGDAKRLREKGVLLCTR